MNFKKLCFVVVVLALLLSACAAAKPEKISNCSNEIKIVVVDLDDKGFSKTFSLPYTWEKTTDESGYDRFEMKYTDLTEYTEYVSQLNKKIDEYNKLVGPLFGEGVLSNYPQMPKIYETPTGVTASYRPDDCYESNSQDFVYLEMNDPWGDYPVTANIVGDRLFVTVTSPAGSVVKYSFPKRLLIDAFDKVFREGNFTMPKGQFETVEITSDQSDFTTNMLENIMSDSASVESVYFSFTADDFEGRRVMKPMIARAMEIAAGEFNSPVLAVLNGYHTSGYKAVTTVTADRDNVSAHGWMFLGMGSMDASGGGSQYYSNSQASMEDLVKGSIYMTPVQ